jgi:hypothetical protein
MLASHGKSAMNKATMRRASLSLACLIAGSLLGPIAARAQSYDISWYKIAGGGGASAGSNYTLSGTIGQVDAGVMSGGTYAISGGFWGIYSVVQMPGSPLLTVTHSGSSVVISWPTPTSNFTLQQNNAVNNAGGWGAVGQTTNSAGGTNSVTIPASGGQLFFRLKSS